MTKKEFTVIGPGSKKDEWLKKERGISSEMVAEIIKNKDYIKIVPNKKYKNQKRFIINIDDYIHSVPFVDDIKDGLLKLMLYNNLDEIIDVNGNQRRKKVVLRLTSNLLVNNIYLPKPKNEIDDFLAKNGLTKKKDLVYKLNEEAKFLL